MSRVDEILFVDGTKLRFFIDAYVVHILYGDAVLLSCCR